MLVHLWLLASEVQAQHALEADNKFLHDDKVKIEQNLEFLNADFARISQLSTLLKQRLSDQAGASSKQEIEEKNTFQPGPPLQQKQHLRDDTFQDIASLRRHMHHLETRLSERLEYFQDASELLAHTPSIRPTKTPWLTSSFGKRRDPMSGRWVMHKGLDLAGAIGLKVMAPADGVVIFVGRRGGYGQTVVVDHGFGLQTHFAHLSRFLVKRGASVRRGEAIAEMGNTGKSTGPHLHYEVRVHGSPIDPRPFILDQ